MAPPWANSGVLLALFLCAVTLSGTDGALVKKDHASHGLRRLRNGMEVTGINRDPFNVAGPQGNFEDINLRIVQDGGGGYHVEDVNGRYEVINDGRGWHHLNGQGSANGYKFHVSRDSSGRYSIDNNDSLGLSPVNKNTIDITIIENNSGGYQLKPEGNFRIVDDGNGWYHTEGEGIYNGQKFRVIRDPYGSFAIQWQKPSSKTVISLGPYKLEFSVDGNGEYHLTPLDNFRIISDGNDWYHPEGLDIPPGYKIHVVRGPDGNFEIKLTQPQPQPPGGVFQIGPYKFKLIVDRNGEYHLTPLGNFRIISKGNDWYYLVGEGIPPGYEIHVVRGPDGNFGVKLTSPGNKPHKIIPIGPYKLEFSVDGNGEYHLTPLDNFRIISDGNDWYHPEGLDIPPGYKIHVVRGPDGNFEIKVTQPQAQPPGGVFQIGPYKFKLTVDNNGEYNLTPIGNFRIVNDGNDWYHLEGVGIPPGYKIHVVRGPDGNFEIKVTKPTSGIFQIGPYKLEFSVDGNGKYHLTPLDNFRIINDGNDWYHPEGVGIPPGYKIHVVRGPDGNFEIKLTQPQPQPPGGVFQIGPYKFKFSVENNGEYHLTPIGNFRIVNDGNDWYHLEGVGIPPGYKIHVVRGPDGNFEIKVTQPQVQPPGGVFQIGPYKFKLTVDSNGEYHLTPLGNFRIISKGNDWYYLVGEDIPPGYEIHVVRGPDGNFGVNVTSPGNNPHQIIPIGPYKLEFSVDGNGKYHLTPLDNFRIISDGNDWYHPEGLDIPPGYKIHVVRGPDGNFEIKLTQPQPQPPGGIFQIGPYKFKFTVDSTGEYHLTPVGNFRIISKGNEWYYLVGEGIPPGYEIHVEKKGGEYVVQTKVPPPNTTPQTPRKQDIQITIVGSGERPLLLTLPPNKVVYDGNNQYHIEGPKIVQPIIFNLIQNPSGTYTIEWRDDPNNPVVTKPVPVTIRLENNPEGGIEPKVIGKGVTIDKTGYNTYVVHVRGSPDSVVHVEKTENQGTVIVQGPPPPIEKVPLTVITYPGGTVISVTSPPNKVVDDGNGKYWIVGPQLVQPVIFYLRQRPDGKYTVEFPDEQGNPVVTKPRIFTIQLESTPEGGVEPKVDGDDATIEKTNYNTYVLHIRGLPDTVFHIEKNDNQEFVVVQGPPPPINEVPLTVITYPGGTVTPVTSPPNKVVDDGNGKYWIVGPQLVQPVIFYLRQRPDGKYTVEFPDEQNYPVVTKPRIITVQLESTPEGGVEPKVDGDDATIEKTNYNTYVLHIRGLPDKVFHVEKNVNQEYVVVQGPPPPIKKVPLTVITYPGGTVISVTSPPNKVVDDGNGKYWIVGPQLVQPVIFYLRQRPDGKYTVEFPDEQNYPVVTKPRIITVQLESTPEGGVEPKVDGDDATVEKTNYNTYVLHIRGLPDTVFNIQKNDNQEFAVVQGPPPPINEVPLTVITYPGGTVISVTSPPNKVVDDGTGKYWIVGPQLVQPVIFYLRQRSDGKYTVEFPDEQNNPVVTKPRIFTIQLESTPEGGVEPKVDGDDATIEKTNYNTYVLHIRGLPDKVFHIEKNVNQEFVVVQGPPPPINEVPLTVITYPGGTVTPVTSPPNKVVDDGNGKYWIVGPQLVQPVIFYLRQRPDGKYTVEFPDEQNYPVVTKPSIVTILLESTPEGGVEPKVEGDDATIEKTNYNTYVLHIRGLLDTVFHIKKNPKGIYIVVPGYPKPTNETTTFPPYKKITVTIASDIHGQPLLSVEPPNNIEVVGDGTFRLHVAGDPLVRTFELIKDQSGKFVISWLEDGSTISPPSMETIKITIIPDNQGRPNPTVESPYYIIRLSENTFELNGPGVHPGKKFTITRGQNGTFVITWINSRPPNPKIKITITVGRQGQPSLTVEPPNYIEVVGDGTFRLHVPGDPLVRTFELIKDQSGKFVISWLEDGSTTSPPSMETIKITITPDNQGRPNPTVESPYYIIRLSENTFELNGPGIHPGKKFTITRGQNGKFVITWINSRPPNPKIKITITVGRQGQPNLTVEPPNYIEVVGDGTFRLHVPGDPLVRTFELIKDQSGKFVISWLEDGSTTSPPSMETIKITITPDNQGRPNPTVESPYYIIRLSENTFELNGPGIHPGKKFTITRGQNGKFVITWINSRPPNHNIKITITVGRQGQPNLTVEPPNYIEVVGDGTFRLHVAGDPLVRTFELIKDQSGKFVISWLEDGSTTSPPSMETIKITIIPDNQGRPNPTVESPYYIIRLSENTFELNGPGVHPGKKFTITRGQNGKFVITWINSRPPNHNIKITITVGRQGQPNLTVEPPNNIEVVGDGTFRLHVAGDPLVRTFELIKDQSGKFVISWLEDGSTTSPPSMETIKITITPDNQGRPNPTVESPYYIIRLSENTFELNGPGIHPGKKFTITRGQNGKFLITWIDSSLPNPYFPNIKITITVDELGRPNPSVEPPNYIVRQPDGTYELNGPGMATSKRFKIIKSIKGEFSVQFINDVDNPSEAINILDGESLHILSPDGSGNRINLQIVEDVGGGYRLQISGERRYRVVGEGEDWFSVIGPNGSRLFRLHVNRNGFGKFTISGIPRHLIVTGNGGMSPNNYGGIFKITAPDGTVDSIGISITDKGNGRYGIAMNGDSRYRIINGRDGWFHLTGPNRSEILKFQVISEPNGGYGLRIVGNSSIYSQGNSRVFDWVPGISTVGHMGDAFNQLLTGVI